MGSKRLHHVAVTANSSARELTHEAHPSQFMLKTEYRMYEKRKKNGWCKIAKSITEINVMKMVKYNRTFLTKKFFFAEMYNRRDGESTRGRTRECMLLYTNTPLGR